MNKSNYEVEILVNGKPVKEYFHNRNTYIEGKNDTEFSIRIKNNGARRIVAVMSVDGLSVMDGEEASPNDSGYIVNGYSSVTVDGWRISDDEVRKFFFTNPENSYAEKSDKGENLGVIGVAVFREKEAPIQINYFETRPKTDIWDDTPKFPPVDTFPKWTCNSSSMGTAELSCSSAGLNSLRSVKQELGTGWGDAKESSVVTVDFERESSADAIFEIFYNTREELKELGIDFYRRPLYVTPQAFPGKYCKPPAN